MPQPSGGPTAALTLRRTVAIVAALNFAYFFVESGVARAIGSVSLYADSIDFLEDTSINLLVLVSLGWSAARRQWVGVGLAFLILAPGAAALWTAWEKLANPLVAEPVALTVTGAGALLVNLGCALLLARVRHQGGSLTTAAFLSARNDVLGNAGIIGAGLLTWPMNSVWPDIVIGLMIAALNAGAAKEVYEAAIGEGDGDGDMNSDAGRLRPPP